MKHEGPFFFYLSLKKTDEGQLEQIREVPKNLFSLLFFWPILTNLENAVHE